MRSTTLIAISTLTITSTILLTACSNSAHSKSANKSHTAQPLPHNAMTNNTKTKNNRLNIKPKPKTTENKQPVVKAPTHEINQKLILTNSPGLNPQALDFAVKGYHWAVEHHDIQNKNILTLVDFNMPSYKKRLWVINLITNKPIMNLYTTQGKNSGLVNATHFTNRSGSDESSLGVYKTLYSYDGKHGLSERLQGLEQGINNNALQRAIVVHPAWYAAPSFVNQHHRAGRSWGCFAIDPAVSDKFIKLTKNGSVLFAYAKQSKDDPNLKDA